jgi:hypothetical protein
MASRPTARATAHGWNDSWWDYVKHGQPMDPAKKAELAAKKKARQQETANKGLRFIILKSSRYVDETDLSVTDAYTGPTCRRAKVEPGQVYTSFETAQADADKLSKFNSAGFEVHPLSS